MTIQALPSEILEQFLVTHSQIKRPCSIVLVSALPGALLLLLCVSKLCSALLQDSSQITFGAWVKTLTINNTTQELDQDKLGRILSHLPYLQVLDLGKAQKKQDFLSWLAECRDMVENLQDVKQRRDTQAISIVHTSFVSVFKI